MATGKWSVRAITLILSCVFVLGHLAVATPQVRADEETPAERDARMRWWREARFGMFIHWGVYSVPAGTYNGKKIPGIGEWIMHRGQIPVERYKKYAEEFNPVKFNAEEWVQLAKDAGQKYIVITSKHHDGFAMYHSKAHPFNIVDATPFKRDPLKELAEACKKHGIKLGFYYSQNQDWTAPGGDGNRWDKSVKGDFDKYLDEKAIPQIKEILTEYGPVAVLWWDTPGPMTKAQGDKLLPLLELQPGILWNNRLTKHHPGDFSTPEQEIPANGIPGRDWETCMTMNDTWGFKSYDHKWKSTETLVHQLIDVASKGGNYLLNVGPTSEGLIPEPSVERLKEVGQWMKVNGEAIYATGANPFPKAPAWGRVTRKPGKLYLHVLKWPKDGKLMLEGLKSKVEKASLLSDPDYKSLDVAQDGPALTITVPDKAPDAIATVIVVEYTGDLELAAHQPAGASPRLIAAPAAKARERKGASPRSVTASKATSRAALAADNRGLAPIRSQDLETKDQRDARMKWWREARFGMFIHWGVYSVPAGIHKGKTIAMPGEWILQAGQIPIAEYKKYSEQFNPVKFDADAWVRLAKEAGQKYIVITTKHHDGFAMYHSQVSDYNIVDATPFKRDPLKELAAACQKHGIKLGLYYSHSQDWTAPGGSAHMNYHWDKPVQDGDFDKYLDEKVAPQVRELLTNYGPIAVFWWDTPINIDKARAQRLAPLLSLQPGILCNSRLMAGLRCDFSTPEQHIPLNKQPHDWETCMTMNGTWGYRSDDHNWKSTETLTRNLIDIASKGGNYLLNVGPTAEGLIPRPSVERLQGIGKWMKQHGEAIYGTTASPLDNPPAWGRITQKPGRLYLHVFDWPNYGYLYVDGMTMKTQKVWLFSGYPAQLEFVQVGNKLRIKLPEQAPDKIASVIVVDYDGPLTVTTTPTLPEETKEQHDARMKWWREARFGMFIHWGLYAVPAGTYKGEKIGNIGEWIMHEAQIPVADYQAFAKQFNPVKFDADEWVRLAKEAGQKYIVITSKHHDGFAMYHSKSHPFNIVDATPFKRDPLKELAAACKKHGVKLGFYYSQAQDWTAPGGSSHRPHWDKAQDGSMDKYIDEKAVPQVKEILTEYGDIAVLWWDTPIGMNKARADKLLPLLKLQPNIIWNNRLGGGYQGDSETPEQTIPATGFKNRDWETCMTMNKTWGYKSYDDQWKSTELLLRNLIDIASKGGNYLLNVGPTAEGEIPGPSIERLKEMGAWLKVNGEAIYATTANPFRKAPTWGRVTKKPGTLYLHVFEWPANQKLTLPTLGADVKLERAWMLADAERRPLEIEAGDETLTITVPKEAPTEALAKIASVVVLTYRGELKPIDFRIRPAADGSLTFGAEDSEIHGHTTTLEGKKDGPKNIGYWRNATNWVSWSGVIDKPGKYTVEVNYSCAPHSKGTAFDVEVGSAKVSGTVEETAGWDNYKTRTIGEVTIDKADPLEIIVRPTKKPGSVDAVMNLRSVTLKPVK